MCVYIYVSVREHFAGMQYECGQSEMVANLGIRFEQSLSALSAPVTEQQGEFSEHYLQEYSASIIVLMWKQLALVGVLERT